MLFFQYMHDCVQKATANYNTTLNWGQLARGITIHKMMAIRGICPNTFERDTAHNYKTILERFRGNDFEHTSDIY
jgi:hypothetical protein